MDLVGACVFCASMLMAVDLPPPSPYSAEIGVAYATLQREVISGSALTDDRSDVTAKSTLVGARWVRMAPADLGAGTPASEVRLRFAFPTSHDESNQSEQSPITVVARGTGRYENFAVLFRRAFSERDSLELAAEHRRHKITDLLTIGEPTLQFSEERDLIAERDEVAIGWRHRWKDLELAGQWMGVRVQGRNFTPQSSLKTFGNLMGGNVELRTSRGPWTASLLAQGLWGNLPTSEQLSQGPIQQFSPSAFLEAVGVSLLRHSRKLDISLSAAVDRSSVPFVSLGVLGTETLAFQSGYGPNSQTKQWFFDLAVRDEIAPGFLPRFFFRFAHGSETVRLTDSAGVLPAATLHILRGGQFPPSGARPSAPEYTIGIALEYGIGARGSDSR
jgi:hypothetical protein